MELTGTTYTLCGLTVRLPFSCPTLTRAPARATPDVTLLEGTVPRRLAAPAAEGIGWQAEPGRFLLRAGRSAGRFLVEGGRQITLERSPAAEDEMLCFHFLDSVLAAVLHQRGMLVLHANAAVTPAGAVVLSGESGAGKSTTLAALMARGFPMLADDVTALRLDSAGRVEVVPGVPQMHLCEDAAAGLGQDVDGVPRHPLRRGKAVIPTRSVLSTTPALLRTFYRLQTHPGDDLRIRGLSGAEKFTAVQDCVYGPLLPPEHPALFPLLAALIEQVPVFRIERPAARWTVEDIAEVMSH